MSQPVKINVARGLMGLVERLAERIPHGQTILNLGGREILHQGLRENPSIPQGEFTPVQLARRIGFLSQEEDRAQIEPRERPRRRRRR